VREGALAAGVVIAERYRVEAVLGAGATGTVYAVAHVRLHRPLAMKVLHPALAGAADLRQRFEREAQAIARLDHPQVLRVVDFGEAPEVGWYLVTERVEGQPLTAALKAHPEWTRQVFLQLLDALEAAHEQGILHRDLKPDNVLVSGRAGRPHVTVLDFGLAKVLFDADATLTQAGAVFGTPRYMSPEQASGEPTSAASDLYAVGVMLFEALEGRPPFEGRTVAELLTQHITAPLPLRQRCPEDTWPVITRALQKAPADRFPRASAFAAALQDTLPEDGDAPAPSPAPAPRPRPWPALLAGAALALAALLVVRAVGDDALADARAHLAAGRLDAAEAVLAGVLAEAPEHPEARLLAGHVAGARGRWRDAAEAYGAALRAEPDLADDERLVHGLPALLEAEPRAAQPLLRWLAEEGPRAAEPALVAVAKDAPQPEARRTAYEGLERLDATDALAPPRYLERELGRAKNRACATRRWYVERLLAQDDAAAQEAARVEIRRKDSLLGLIPQSGCMQDLLRNDGAR
jgi:tRNA A-37 threonylcarbamoyl transferase component Bud32